VTAAWVGALAAVVAVVLAGPARWAWRLLRGTSRFLDDWAGHGERPGVMDRLAAVERNIVEVRTQIRPDHGHSLRDVVHRTASDVADVKTDVAKLASRVELFEHQREDRDKP
jgi:hypothetical protein